MRIFSLEACKAVSTHSGTLFYLCPDDKTIIVRSDSPEVPEDVVKEIRETLSRTYREAVATTCLLKPFVNIED